MAIPSIGSVLFGRIICKRFIFAGGKKPTRLLRESNLLFKVFLAKIGQFLPFSGSL